MWDGIERRLVERKDPIINHLLIIDDDSLWVDTFKRLFSNTARVIDSVPDGQNALLKLYQSDYEYQCILLDIRLPDTNGLSLLDDIKKTHPKAKIISVTAHDEEYKEMINHKVKTNELFADWHKTDSIGFLRFVVNANFRIDRMANV